jgi:hypothetical protein
VRQYLAENSSKPIGGRGPSHLSKQDRNDSLPYASSNDVRVGAGMPSARVVRVQASKLAAAVSISVSSRSKTT